MSFRIAILVEGGTEKAFFPVLREFLTTRLAGRMPNLDPMPCDGRIPKGNELCRRVRHLLRGRSAADAVIALTDVYTGSDDFQDADDAKAKMLAWVGEEPRFHPHVALHDFEAWLLPFWPAIQELSGSNRVAPAINPETVNHMNPPARVLAEVFRTGSRAKRYVKPRDALRVLRNKDLTVAAQACAELRLFLNRILTLAGGSPL
jgi:Domain of unknown function (DUF4276)